MADEDPQGCVEPAEGPIANEPAPATSNPSTDNDQKEVTSMQVMVGKKAPDFGANAFHKGNFTSVKLSDFLGNWVFLCFYPGDFTFV